MRWLRLVIMGGCLGGVIFHYLTGRSWGDSLPIAAAGALGAIIAVAIFSVLGLPMSKDD